MLFICLRKRFKAPSELWQTLLKQCHTTERRDVSAATIYLDVVFLPDAVTLLYRYNLLRVVSCFNESHLLYFVRKWK